VPHPTVMHAVAPDRGSGPGVQAPDGSSVELYRRIPYLGELEQLLPLLARGSRVLELGCGTGRLSARLVDAGFAVTGVDNCRAMLAVLPPSIAAVESGIETLALPPTFDAVLLAGALINHADPARRRAFLACARRHLRDGGSVLVQRHNPEWLSTAAPGDVSHVDAISIHVDAVRRGGSLVAMTLRYVAGEQAWLHVFTAAMLDDAEIEAELQHAGFADAIWRDADRTWVSAFAAGAK